MLHGFGFDIQLDKPDNYERNFKVFEIHHEIRKVLSSSNQEQLEEKFSAFIEEKWYNAHNEFGWYNSHLKTGYYGYWAFEIGALTCILNIDDISYRNNEYYPKDLVDHYRSMY
ncbi:MAG: DUF1911 domain-containing protein [Crocinitomicaceae bacterium]|nr:DUF1911 domain-containing protein [Crocinitomicaceae bacterium]